MTHLPSQYMRVIAGTMCTVAIAVCVSGCGSPDITRTRLEHDIAPSFAGQYRQQQRQLGKRQPTRAAIAASSSCTKGGATVPDKGPGKDWVCVVTWINAHGKHHTSRYEVNARTEACYTATDPALTAHHQFITDTADKQVDNPLYQFDGCFSIS